jgi:hypothetical protein
MSELGHERSCLRSATMSAARPIADSSPRSPGWCKAGANHAEAWTRRRRQPIGLAAFWVVARAYNHLDLLFDALEPLGGPGKQPFRHPGFLPARWQLYLRSIADSSPQDHHDSVGCTEPETFDDLAVATADLLGVTSDLSSGVAAAAVAHRDDFHPRPPPTLRVVPAGSKTKGRARASRRGSMRPTGLVRALGCLSDAT